VGLEYSADGGTNFLSVMNAISSRNSPYDWDLRGLTSGSNYVLRLVCEADPVVCATVAPLRVLGVRSFFVNDSETLGDVYCTSAGNEANSGLTPAAPKASLQAVLNAYDLGPGDTIYVDTGFYGLSSNIVVTAADGGAALSWVTIRGSTNGQGTVIDRGSTVAGTCGVKLDGCVAVRLDSLSIRNAHSAVHVSLATGCGVERCRVQGCTNGVEIVGGSGHVVGNTVIAGNTHGVYVTGVPDVVLRNNTFFGNAVAALRFRAGGNGGTTAPIRLCNNIFAQ
jgi:hypothetical protein